MKINISLISKLGTFSHDQCGNQLYMEMKIFLKL